MDEGGKTLACSGMGWRGTKVRKEDGKMRAMLL